MSKLVLTDEAKWYIAKCFDGLDEFERYQKAVKNFEEMANNAVRDSGKLHYARYRKKGDGDLNDETRWDRDIAGISRYGNTIIADPWAFEEVDK